MSIGFAFIVLVLVLVLVLVPKEIHPEGDKRNSGNPQGFRTSAIVYRFYCRFEDETQWAAAIQFSPASCKNEEGGLESPPSKTH